MVVASVKQNVFSLELEASIKWVAPQIAALLTCRCWLSVELPLAVNTGSSPEGEKDTQMTDLVLNITFWLHMILQPFA